MGDPKPSDPELAEARNVLRRARVYGGFFETMNRESLTEVELAIASALRAERERALEDVEMAVAGYVAMAAGPKHVEGVRVLIRALKGGKWCPPRS